MPKSPACELRARQHNPTDPFAVSYKVYASGRLKGAIIPIQEADGARWESIALDGSVRRWRFRNQARDFLCGLPVIRAGVSPGGESTPAEQPPSR